MTEQDRVGCLAFLKGVVCGFGIGVAVVLMAWMNSGAK